MTMNKPSSYGDDLARNNKRTFHPLKTQDQPDEVSSKQTSPTHVKKQDHERDFDVDEHPFELRHEVKRLNKRLDQIADTLEKAEFKDIIENYSSTKRRIISNLTAGISRGLGLTLGTVVVLALLAWLLSFLVQLNLPVIGDFIAELLGYIKMSQGTK
ncbi:DUF5665 domain-containing protein [Paenibacillus polymyxa]|uniref:DUF5665 domain-containing protein n=1 Tax=Paenibacillus polymyxa TaxID=1406 RepID=UPI0025B667C2|nr:DUF5665 domain-containing protein [Paenibacillus polymyxa]MDN4083353.1 DUF5665 domain-containing protein [Paenibacillus polymyxa]MDN4089802.1 DUF5665 domain-containing protein [Paenibacillus polymyxa]MDN4110576.1 DUF5665 domain-containing protein [Paenibacillus polymyxa]